MSDTKSRIVEALEEIGIERYDVASYAIRDALAGMSNLQALIFLASVLRDIVDSAPSASSCQAAEDLVVAILKMRTPRDVCEDCGGSGEIVGICCGYCDGRGA